MLALHQECAQAVTIPALREIVGRRVSVCWRCYCCGLRLGLRPFRRSAWLVAPMACVRCTGMLLKRARTIPKGRQAATRPRVNTTPEAPRWIAPWRAAAPNRPPWPGQFSSLCPLRRLPPFIDNRRTLPSPRKRRLIQLRLIPLLPLLEIKFSYSI